MTKQFAITAALILTLGVPTIASAWGREGHAIVAAIAQANLTPVARAEVKRLLAVEPGATLESVTPWADQTRNRTSARWHFTNLPEGDCDYVPARDCHKGACLVAATQRFVRALADPSRSDVEREVALKYVVHFAGDAVQPLHNYGPKKGANQYQVRYEGRGTNLHAVWDSGLLRSLASRGRSPIAVVLGMHYGTGAAPANYAGVARRLVLRSQKRTFTTSTDPVVWTAQACGIAHTPGLFPPRVIPLGYETTWQPVMENQLVRGGLQLAAILNQVLGEQRPGQR